jgi:O-antigen ligase
MTLRYLSTLVLLSGVLAYAAINNAGAGLDPQAWHWSMLFVGLIGCLHFGIRSTADSPGLDRFALVTASLFLFVAVLQVIPLPVAWVQILSPARVDLLRGSLLITKVSPNFVSLSVVPYQTAHYLITLAGYAIIALVVRDLTLQLNASPWITSFPILILGTIEAILGFVQASNGAADSSAAGTFPNRDHYAGLLEMVLPFAAMIPIAILQRDRRRHESPAAPAIKACIFLAMAAALLVGIIYSLSRMGFIASLAGLFVAGSIAFSLRGFRTHYEVSANWLRRWAPSFIVAMVVGAGFIFLPTDPLIARFSDLAKTDEVSADTRLQIWRDTAGLIKDYPILGCGLGGYYSSFLRYKTAAPMNTVDYAHNDYLQVLAEMGALGFVTGLLFVLRVLQRAIRGARYAQSIDTRYLAIACTASMTAMLLHSIVDFDMYVPVNGLVFVWILGIAGIFLGRPGRGTHATG